MRTRRGVDVGNLRHASHCVAGRFSQADTDGDHRLSTAQYRDLVANVLGLPEPQPLGSSDAKR